MDRLGLAALVEENIDGILSDLAKQLNALEESQFPSNHRLNGLGRALAWHETRKTPGERLAELDRELIRLQGAAEKQGAGPGGEAELYAWLSDAIGAGRAGSDWRPLALADLNRAGEDTTRSEPELDLLMAQETLRILLTLVRGRPLQTEIEETFGGTVRWS